MQAKIHITVHSGAGCPNTKRLRRYGLDAKKQRHTWSAALTSTLAGGAAARALSASLSCRTCSGLTVAVFWRIGADQLVRSCDDWPSPNTVQQPKGSG
jgi:hypothetical protein